MLASFAAETDLPAPLVVSAVANESSSNACPTEDGKTRCFRCSLRAYSRARGETRTVPFRFADSSGRSGYGSPRKSAHRHSGSPGRSGRQAQPGCRSLTIRTGPERRKLRSDGRHDRSIPRAGGSRIRRPALMEAIRTGLGSRTGSTSDRAPGPAGSWR